MRSVRTVLLVASALLFFSGRLAFPQSAAEGERIFKAKCTACHTMGGGKLIGPDLRGVTSRRDESWLKRQIKEPDRLIAEGDPIATQLVKDMNMAMVPLGLSESDVESVIEFLEHSDRQNGVAAGVPPLYFPTLLVGVVAAVGLTGLALRFGRKRVDVR